MGAAKNVKTKREGSARSASAYNKHQRDRVRNRKRQKKEMRREAARTTSTDRRQDQGNEELWMPSCEARRSWSTFSEAERYCESALALGTKRPVFPYQCVKCGKWHISPNPCASEKMPIEISKSLDGLAEQIASCRRCTRFYRNKGTVPPITCLPAVGSPDATVMVVRQFPSAAEHGEGRAFIEGGDIEVMLDMLGVDPYEDAYVTSVARCYARLDRRYHPDEDIATCVEYLMREIELVEPLVVISIGRAIDYLLGMELDMEQERGWLHRDMVLCDGKTVASIFPISTTELADAEYSDTLAEDMARLREDLIDMGGI